MLIYDCNLQLLWWTQSMNPSRMRMDFSICATAVKRPLAMLEFILVNVTELRKVMLILYYSVCNYVF